MKALFANQGFNLEFRIHNLLNTPETNIRGPGNTLVDALKLQCS